MYKSLKSTTYGFGDAILETSSTGTGSAAWNGDYSYFARTGHAVFVRGGACWDNSSAGVFTLNATYGNPYYYHGFRAILIGKI